MSPLTKIFIVFHVVLSLLLAAGLIVFVDRTQDYKTALTTATATAARAQTEMRNAQNDARAQESYAQAARVDRDTAIANDQKALSTTQDELARANVALADAQSNAKTLQVSLDTLTSAVNASEAQRKALSDLLDTTRTDNNTLNTKNNQLNLAVSDLTNKLEVATRLVSNYQETISENKSKIETLQKQMADAGMNPATADHVGLAAGAPPINGVVRSNRLINGIPYATISVGANDQVVKGMKFNVVDNGNFLGELTIEQVDEREATGKLEGPKIGEVHPGVEVKTQL